MKTSNATTPGTATESNNSTVSQIPHAPCLLPMTLPSVIPSSPSHQPSQEAFQKQPLKSWSVCPNEGASFSQQEAGGPPTVQRVQSTSKPQQVFQETLSSSEASRTHFPGAKTTSPEASGSSPGGYNGCFSSSNSKLCSTCGALYCPSVLPCASHR